MLFWLCLAVIGACLGCGGFAVVLWVWCFFGLPWVVVVFGWVWFGGGCVSPSCFCWLFAVWCDSAVLPVGCCLLRGCGLGVLRGWWVWVPWFAFGLLRGGLLSLGLGGLPDFRFVSWARVSGAGAAGWFAGFGGV